MKESVRSFVIELAEARAQIPSAGGAHSTSLFQRGTLNVKLSMPVSPNRQTQHEQDELYIIVRGSGVLFHDGKRDRVNAGDLMFIAAGTEHRFEDFTEDLSVWVVFYGPVGGEVPD
jgi:mannose-6-phosphate isomerase-like protein (cupin superfamily)